MKLKSYFSGTVEAAMDMARRELGDEALLVNARPSTPDTRHLGAYEVVFGLPPDNMDQFTRELAGLRLEMDRFKASVRGRATLETIATNATLGLPGSECAVAALVGPPGAGKTTTLIKLAAHYGLAGRRRTQILSVDVHRIGAADQLRALASILGLGCDVVETPLALAQAIDEHRSKHLILIDTPGLSTREMDAGAALAELLASPDIDTHLVLPASMKAAALARIIGQYAIFQPKKLIFTRIDEIADYTDLLTEAARCVLPVSFMCGGQRIPDDIEPATPARLSELAGRTQEQHTLGATA